MNFSAGYLTQIDEHIIEICYTRDAEIDQKMAIEVLNHIIELSGGGPHALLYNFGKHNVIISEIARKLSGVRNYNNANLISRAFVSNTMTSNMEVSYYINHDKPQAETKFFNTKEKALAWLNQKVEAFLHVS